MGDSRSHKAHHCHWEHPPKQVARTSRGALGLCWYSPCGGLPRIPPLPAHQTLSPSGRGGGGRREQMAAIKAATPLSTPVLCTGVGARAGREAEGVPSPGPPRVAAPRPCSRLTWNLPGAGARPWQVLTHPGGMRGPSPSTDLGLPTWGRHGVGWGGVG